MWNLSIESVHVQQNASMEYTQNKESIHHVKEHKMEPDSCHNEIKAFIKFHLKRNKPII